jgi:histidinol-phosphate aminotransferase
MFKYNPHINQIDRKLAHRLNINENFRLDMAERVNNFPEQFYKNFLTSIKQEDFICYPSVYEYELLAKKIACLNDVNENHIFISNGSDSIIKTIYELVCNKKTSNIITSNPCFPMYEVYANIINAKIKKINYEENLNLSLQKIINNIDKNTRLVILANPNSPIGDFKEIEEIKEFLEFLNKNKILFVLDEAYVDYAPYSMVDLIKQYDNIIILKTFSKSFGAAGCRVGYAIADKKIIELLQKLRQPFSLTTVSTKFAIELLNNINIVKHYINEVRKEKKVLSTLFLENNYDIIGGHCNWLHFNNKKDNLREEKILKKHGVSFKNNVKIPYDSRENWIRLVIGPNLSTQDFITEMFYGLETNF